jgi:hypothetical protein
LVANLVTCAHSYKYNTSYRRTESGHRYCRRYNLLQNGTNYGGKSATFRRSETGYRACLRYNLSQTG